MRSGSAADAGAVELLDELAGRQRRGDRLQAAALVLAEHGGQLEQRQRVAARRGRQRVGDRRHDAVGEQRAGALAVQAAELEDLQPGGVQAGAARAGARAEQHADALGVQPARGEHERLPGGGVEPLRIVDRDEQRAVLGGVAEQREHRDRDREPAVLAGRAERERRAQRGGLLLGQRVGEVEQRPDELEQARVRDLGLPSNPRPRRTRNPSASSRIACRSAVLPMPASPVTTTAKLRPSRASRRRVLSSSSSCSRPCSTRRP